MKAKLEPRIILKGRESLENAIPLLTPWVVFVDPSDSCNFRCKFCPTGDPKLMYNVGRPQTIMSFDLYKKIIDDICEFDKPIKVLRLYKDGEPLVNGRFTDMVRYGIDTGCCETIDTTTNGSLLNPKKNLEIIEAGLDRINISVEGINAEQYMKFSSVHINFDKFVYNITDFYDKSRGKCEMFIKINGDYISEGDKEFFFDTFGDICDSINVEHTMNCWNNFEMKDGKENNEIGLYGQPIKEVSVCPYVFYSLSINSDGRASICFLDWNRKLICGDARVDSIKEIWDGVVMNTYRTYFLMNKRNEHPICSKCGQLSHGMPVDLDQYSDIILKRLLKNEMSNLLFE